jgi:hypothetical protein
MTLVVFLLAMVFSLPVSSDASVVSTASAPRGRGAETLPPLPPNAHDHVVVGWAADTLAAGRRRAWEGARTRRQSGEDAAAAALALTIACVQVNCTSALVACSTDPPCGSALTTAFAMAASGGDVASATAGLPASSATMLLSVMTCAAANCGAATSTTTVHTCTF